MNEEIRSALIRVLPFVVILFILLLQIKKGRITKQALFLNKPSTCKYFFYWVIGFLLLVLTIEYCLYKTAFLEVDKWQHPFLSSVIRITVAIFLAPIVEELIFRGLLLNMLIKRNVNLHLAIFIQAGVFIMLHNFTYQNSLNAYIGIVQSLMDAMLFGYAKYTTRSIYTPMAMHITGNIIATAERFIL
jgi:membrane protease YdiL (CAAX protease family)